MRTKYITWEQYTKQEEKIKNLKSMGIIFIHKKSKIKIILGSVCLVIAIVPNGLGILFYPLGFSLLVSGGVDIYTLIQSNKQKFKVKMWEIRRKLGL